MIEIPKRFFFFVKCPYDKLTKEDDNPIGQKSSCQIVDCSIGEKKMIMVEVVELNEIGPVVLTTKKGIRRLSIRVRPFKGIEVSIPFGTPPLSVATFLKHHKEWMIRAIEKVKVRENEWTFFDEHTQFKTRSFALKIEPADRVDVRLIFKNGNLLVLYPAHMNVRTQSIQDVIRNGIEEALRVEAKKYLPVRLSELASQNGFSYRRVFVKNLKTRWGSCSGVDNINLNLHLMRLPDHLIDYVLLHELCHTREKNHGPQFKKLLNQLTEGQCTLLEREMKTYKTVIY